MSDPDWFPDIALKWMVDAAQAVPDGIKLDPSVLKPYPSTAGMQHDEARSLLFRWFGKIVRKIPSDAPLHPSVYERAALAAVLNYDLMEQYRRRRLEGHTEFQHRCGRQADGTDEI